MEESAAKAPPRELAAHCTMTWGMVMPEVLLTTGREKGSLEEVVESAFSKTKM